jgi:hypothetical protein
MKPTDVAADELDRKAMDDLDDLFCGCRGAIAPLCELSDDDTRGRHPAAGRVEDDLDAGLDAALDELAADTIEGDLQL